MGEQELKCRHIYESVGQELCPDCGRDTHETDFKFEGELHRKWIEEGKADWNVCPQGGTIRGWWSI